MNYVPGHAGVEGNEKAHRLSMEGMCLSGMWAYSHILCNGAGWAALACTGTFTGTTGA